MARMRRHGIAAPARTPRYALDRISREIAAILTMPVTLEFMAKQGAGPLTANPAQASAIVREEIARYAKIIKDAGIKYLP